ncbi:MAG TPA: HD domain-containing phosphohydrolase [Candidatus Sulfotelmatobacter sp.]
MTDKILFVDDEPAVLDGYKRMLHREFKIETAVGGFAGLAAVQTQGPFAVVVSDMRMPEMDGAAFLAQVRAAAPDTIRMLLTGHADVDAAIQAVNEGNIFRFLTKPCAKEVLGKALTIGLVQYRLVTAEKDLLENTLMGSIKVLTEILSAASPESFGRSSRLAKLVKRLADKFGLPSPWRFEAAAMLSQLGCMMLNPELVEAAYLGKPLSSVEQERFAAHPQVARDLLMNIPRLEPIAWMISRQLSATPVKGSPGDDGWVPDVVLGAKMLRVAVAFDNLKMAGLAEAEAVAELRKRENEFDPQLLEALLEVGSASVSFERRTIPISSLACGMILEQEVRTQSRGLLLAAKGQEVTPLLQIKLGRLAQWGSIEDKIEVSVPGALIPLSAPGGKSEQAKTAAATAGRLLE